MQASQGSSTAALTEVLCTFLCCCLRCVPHIQAVLLNLRLIWFSHKVTFLKKAANFTQFPHFFALGQGTVLLGNMATCFAPQEYFFSACVSVSSPRRPRCWNIWQRRENMSEKCFKKLWRRTITSAKWQRKSWYWKWNRSKKTVKLI